MESHYIMGYNGVQRLFFHRLAYTAGAGALFMRGLGQCDAMWPGLPQL